MKLKAVGYALLAIALLFVAAAMYDDGQRFGVVVFLIFTGAAVRASYRAYAVQTGT